MVARVEVRPEVRRTVVSEVPSLYANGWIPRFIFEPVTGGIVCRVVNWANGQGARPGVGYVTASGTCPPTKLKRT